MSKSFFFRICLILATIAGLAALFYLPYRTVKHKTIADHTAEQVFLARQAAQGIANTFAMYGKGLRYFASHPSIIDLDDTGRRMLFDFYAVHKPSLVSIARLDPEGNIIYRISNADLPDDTILQNALATLNENHRQLIDVIAPGQTLAAFSWPVKGGEQPSGSIILLVSFQELAHKFLAPLRSSPGKRLWVINRDGIVLDCPNSDHKGAHVSETTTKIDRNSSLLNSMRRMIDNGNGEGSFEITDRGNESSRPLKNHVVFMPVPLPGGNHWSIAYATQENIVLANMNTFRNYWLLVSSIALIVLLLLSCFLIRSMIVTEEEKKRRTAENQLRELMDFTPIGIIVYDVQGQLRYANKTARKIWGNYTDIAIDTINIFDFIDPAHREAAKQRFKDVLRGKPSEPSVIELVFPNNIKRSVEISSAPFYFAGQRCGVTVLQDVTQRLEDEEEQRRLATAVANTNDSIVITDPDGTIQYVNPAFTRITGYSREEAIGQTTRILKSGFHDQAFYRKMWGILGRGQVWEGRLVNRKKNGSTYTELASISPILDSAGNIMHYVAVKRDISHEVQLESQLHQAQKMEAIGTLAGGIAHDFNNILGAIIGFTDISLLQTPADSAVHDNLQQIKKSGQRAADLVQQILTFSRMAAKKDKIDVAVAPLVKETMKLLRASIPTTIGIKLEINEPDGWVLADPVQIQQIIMNLCTNAFHAMREKGGTLTISLGRLPLGSNRKRSILAEKSCIELKIADTGHGIDAAIIDRIFDPFFTTKDPGVGTGMGLSVVHGIIQDLGGMITVDSSSAGACFTVLLPEREPPPREKEEDFTTLQTGTESILIVDDEQVIQDTARMMLEQLGYQVMVTGSPKNALALIRDPANHFDLVISDQTMPEMTGLDMLGEIKQTHPDLPVILCTGFSEQLNKETAQAMGARMYLMKPINFRQLAGIVRQVLDIEAPEEENRPGD